MIQYYYTKKEWGVVMEKEELKIVLAVICGAVALVGAFCVVFQIYHMTVIDATARGLKHPKFWGVFTMSGNNSSGLLMYLMFSDKLKL